MLCAKLRPSNIDGSEGPKEEVERIVKHIRKQWPDVRIILRGDSGFAREELMRWCETNGVDYLFGLAKNPHLITMIEREQEDARKEYNYKRFINAPFYNRDGLIPSSYKSERFLHTNIKLLQNGKGSGM